MNAASNIKGYLGGRVSQMTDKMVPWDSVQNERFFPVSL